MTRETARTITSASKHVLRNFVPDFLLKKRDIIRLLGPNMGLKQHTPALDARPISGRERLPRIWGSRELSTGPSP